MSVRLVQANEPLAARRRVYFDVRGEDGTTPYSASGYTAYGLFDGVGGAQVIGGVIHAYAGRHYADLPQAWLVSGRWIETVLPAPTAAFITTPGDSVMVVDYNPYTDIKTILNQALLIGAIPASFPASTGSVFDATGAETAVYWSQAFIGTGQDITGWTRLAFTLKDNPSADDDGDALLTVRLSNPAAAGTDGILVHNRRAVPAADALRAAGIITVETLNPAQVRATLLPAALQLPPSPDNLPYSFEWDWWDGAGIKRQIGRGDFTLARSVRRGTVAP